MTAPVLLDGVTVLELSSRPSGAYCGRILADLGAAVTRVELPFVAHAHPDVKDALLRSLHAGKAVVSAAAALADGLPARVDLVVVDAAHDDAADGAVTAVVRDVLAATPAGVLVTDVNDFGAEAPYDAWRGTSLLTSAWSAASWSIGEREREPLSLPYDIPDYLAGAEAAGASVLSLLLRDAGAHTGAATVVAVSDIVAYYVGMITTTFVPYGRPWHRDGARAYGSAGFYPAGIFPCSDGAIALTCRQPSEWQGLIAMLGHPDWSDDPRFADGRVVAEKHADELDEKLMPWIAARTVHEVFELAQTHGVAAIPVLTVADALAHEQLEHRGFFEPLPDAGGRVLHPGRPYKLTATGSDPERAARPLRRPATPEQPLAGLRVLDFTWVWSGPTVTAGLADLGAEVIKVEHAGRLDPARLRGRGLRDGHPAPGPEYDTAPYFNQLNRGKRSLTVDLTTPEGAEVIRRLAAECDVVVESMRPRALVKRGIDFATLAEQNPGLVVMSMAVVGQHGPLSHIRGYALVMSGLSGLDALVAYEPRRPMGLYNLSLGDANAAGHALGVLLAAILRQRRTGAGCYVDVSQTECLASILRAPLLESQLVGAVEPPANRHSDFAPYGHVRCAGDDSWIAVAARTDRERSGLATLVGTEEPLEDALAAWALERGAVEAVDELRAAGVPASPVNAWEVLIDSQWARDRQLRVPVEHPHLGTQEIVRLPWSVSGSRPTPQAGAPCLGADSAEILADVLPEAGLARPR